MDSGSIKQEKTVSAAGETVLVEIVTNLDRFAEDLKKRTGLYAPTDVLQGQPNMGRVYDISKEIKKPTFREGEIIIFIKKDQFEGFKADGKKLVSIQHSEIVGKLTDD